MTDIPIVKKRDRTHWLYIAVIVAVAAGIIVGLAAPEAGSALGVLGTMFVSLIKMMISPVIFCTIVLGIGSVRKAASVGKVGGLVLTYFLVMSTIALGIGLVVGNLISPGTGLNVTGDPGAGAELVEKAHGAGGTMEFIEGIIPTSLLSSLTAGNVLQTLFVALLTGGGAIEGVAYASPRRLDVGFNMGGGFVDLHGTWLRDSAINIDQNMGGATVRLPRDVIIRGLDRLGMRPPPETEIPPPVLTITTSSSFGNLEFIH